MKRYLSYIMGAALLAAACSEKDDSVNPYDNWASRNATWFAQVYDSAATAINAAKQADADNWEQHCDWRLYRSVKLQPGDDGDVMSYVCMKYLKRSTDTGDRPLWDDSVRINYRGWLMPTDMYMAGVPSESRVFDQSYYGAYNDSTAYPQQLCVKGTVTGFATALQYMHRGDEVMLYIPSTLGYGEAGNNNVPAGSTLLFRLHLIDFYHADERVPVWN